MKKALFTVAVLALGTAQMASAQSCLSIDDMLKGGEQLPSTIQINNTEFSLDIGGFWEMGNPPTPASGGFTELDKPECNGTDFGFRLGKATLVVTHVDGDQPKQISFRFCDFGGHQNVAANRDQPPEWVDDVRRLDGEILPDHDRGEVNMRVQVTRELRNSANVVRGYEGVLDFEGQDELQTVQFGGEELFITHICAG